jgi:uridylate kinase
MEYMIKTQKYQDAKKFDSLTIKQAVENPEIKVMDKAAMGLS